MTCSRLLEFFENPGCSHWKGIAHRSNADIQFCLEISFTKLSVELKNDVFVWD